VVSRFIFHAWLIEVTLDFNLLWGPNYGVINETSFVVVYISVTVCWSKIWMQFFPIKMTFNDCTIVILTSWLLQKWFIFRKIIWMRSFQIRIDRVVANRNFTWPIICLRFFVQKLIKCCSWKVNEKMEINASGTTSVICMVFCDC